MVSVQRGPVNTGSFSSTGGSGYPGDAATGFALRNFIKVFDSHEPQRTIFLSSLDKRGTVTASNEGKIEWAVKARLPMTVTLDQALNNSDTDFDVASGHASRLQKGNVLRIPVDASGNAEELVWIGATPTSDNIASLKRGYGGTSAVAHDTGTVIEVLAPAMPENSQHPPSPVVFGDIFYNRVQRMPYRLDIDLRADVSPNLQMPKANILQTRLEEKITDAKKFFNKSLVQGQRHAEDYTSGAQIPSSFSGIRHFATLSGNVYDLEDGLLNWRDVQDVFADFYEQNEEGGMTVMCNMRTALLWDTQAMQNRLATVKDTEWDTRLMNVKTRVGDIKLMVEDDVPAGEMIIYAPKYAYYAPVKGLDWHITKYSPEITQGDMKGVAFSADMTFIYEQPDTLAIIKGFDTDINNYSLEVA